MQRCEENFVQNRPFICLQTCKASVTDEENNDNNLDTGREIYY